jgi:hypothetical protein
MMTATEAAGSARRGEESAFTGMERYFLDSVRAFVSRTDEFIQRQYRDIIRGSPTAEQLEEHRRELKWAICLSRLFCRAASSDQFADHSLAALLGGRLRQLEESWKLLFESPSKEEAEKLDRLIEEHFPDEARA